MTGRRRLLLLPPVLAAALAIVLAGSHALGWWGGRSGSLVLYGNVDIRQVDLGFRVPGRIGAMAAEEGDHVRAGARLAALDMRPLNDRLATAVAGVDLAAADLEKMRNGNRRQEIAEAKALLVQRQADLVRAREDYDRRRALVAGGAVSQALFDQTVAALHVAQQQEEAAAQAYSLQKEGYRREDVAAAAARLASARASRAGAETDLADAVIHAPGDGVILTRAREPGAIVQAGETVYTLTIDRPMRVRAYVAEPDLGRISPGMAVTVRADGNPRTYHGTIGYIAPTAEFTPKTVETESLRSDLVYRLRVIVTDPDDALRQGQPVTVGVPGARPPAGAGPQTGR